MNKDLGLDQGNKYSVALVVFFIPYLLFEVIPLSASRFLLLRANPALAALKSSVASNRVRELVVIHRLCLGYCHVRPGMIQATFLPIILSFPITDRCVDLQGFVKSYGPLVLCRFILGFFEAGGVAILPMIRISQLMR